MADYNTEQFEKDCKALGVTLSDEQIQQFLKYYEMLVEWNEVMNLTAITEYDEVMKNILWTAYPSAKPMMLRRIKQSLMWEPVLDFLDLL